MKFVLLLALIGLAASATVPAQYQRLPTDQLAFVYDTQVATGTEEVSDDFSTLRMRAQVLMKKEGEARDSGAQKWTVSMSSIRIFHEPNATETLPKTLVPLKEFRPLKEKSNFVRASLELQQPILVWIEPRTSKIVKAAFPKNNNHWAINVYKGFLSLLQVNFQNQDDSAAQMQTGQWTKEVNEETVAGKCKTLYIAKRIEDTEVTNTMLKVDKAIDFHSCQNPITGAQEMPGMWNGLHHSETIQTEANKDLLNINHWATYTVRMSTDAPVIDSMSARTTYTLAPFAKSTQGTKKVIVLQSLRRLENQEKTEGPTTSRRMSTDLSSMVQHEQPLRLVFPEEDKNINKEEMVQQMLKKFDSVLKSDNQVDIQTFHEILTMLRLYINDQDVLRQVAEQLVRKDNRQQLLKIFILDLCPQVGSHGSVQFLMQVVRQLVQDRTDDVITAAKLSIYDIPAIFTKLSMKAKVQAKSLRTVLEAIKSEQFNAKLMNHEHVPIFSSAWMSLGAMINVFYSQQGGADPCILPIADAKDQQLRHQQAPWKLRQEQAQTSEEVRGEFVQQIRNALHMNEVSKVIAIKVIKNSGLFELYEDLHKIIADKHSQTVTNRVHAVYATQKMLVRHTLNRVMSQDPRTILDEQKFMRSQQEFLQHFDQISRKIQTDLLKTFKNAREDPEVRIACYRVLMQSPIKRTILNMLVQAIAVEPTQQVYAYCVQHMDQVVQNDLAAYQNVRQLIRPVISMIKRREPTLLTYSRVFQAQLLDRLHELGLTVETDMIMSDKSFTPRWTHFKLDHQLMGRNVPVLEIAVRTDGLQKMLTKLFAAGDVSDLYNKLAAGLRRSRRSIDLPIDFQSELIDILPRLLQDVPNMDLTVALLGNDVVFVKNSKQVLRSAEKMDITALIKSFSSLGRLINPITSFFTFSAINELPTPAGTILDIGCLLNFNFLPQISMDNDFNDKVKMMLTARLPLNVQMYRRIGNSMQFLEQFQQSVTELRVNPSSSFTVGFELKKGDDNKKVISLLLSTPTTSTPVLKIRTEVLSTVAEYKVSTDRSAELRGVEGLRTEYSDFITNHPIRPAKVFQPTSINFQPQLNAIWSILGIKMTVKGQHYSNKDLFQSPCALMMGNSQMEIFVSPLSDDTESSVRFNKISLQVQQQSDEQQRLPNIELRMSQVAQDIDTEIRQVLKAVVQPKEVKDKSIQLEAQIQRFTTSGDDKFRCQVRIQLPQDLMMTPRLLDVQINEWVQDRQMRMEVQVNQGDENKEIAKVSVILRTNPELMKLRNTDIREKQLVWMFPTLKKCVNEAKNTVWEIRDVKHLYTPSCIQQFRQLNQLNTIEITVHKNKDFNMGSWQLWNYGLTQANDWLKPFQTQQQQRRSVDSSRPIRVVIQSSIIDTRVQQVRIETPFTSTQWQAVQLPFAPFFWDGVEPLTTSVMDHVRGGVSKCSLLNSHIQTFDSVVYSIPRTFFNHLVGRKCPLLLARDCSDSKKFQIFTHVSDGQKVVTLQLNNGNQKPLIIKAWKSFNDAETRTNIQVAGERIDDRVPETQQLEQQIFNREIFLQGKEVQVQVSRYFYAGTVMYRIRVSQPQLELLVGGPRLRSVHIRVSPLFNNKMCGLCGDYNAEMFQEFKAPNFHRIMRSPQSMIQQYILPVSDSCRELKQRQADDQLEAHKSLTNSWTFDDTYDNSYQEQPRRSLESYDTPARKQTCQMFNDRRVLTFKNAMVSLLPRQLQQQILQHQACGMKLVTAKVGDHQAVVFLKNGFLVVKIGSFQQIVPTTRSSIELSSDRLPAGLNANAEDVEGAVQFSVEQGEQQLVIQVTQDRRVIIRATQPEQDSTDICEMRRDIRVQDMQKDELISFLERITTAQEDESCKQHLQQAVREQHRIRSNSQTCQVKTLEVTAFKRFSKPQPIKFLNEQLAQKLAESQSPILVSADQLDTEEAGKLTLRVMYSLQGTSDKQQPVISIYKNNEQLVQLQAGSSADSVQVQKRSAETQELSSSKTQLELDDGFKAQIVGDKVRISHQSNQYSVEITISALQRNVMDNEELLTISRPQPGRHVTSVGLCDAHESAHMTFDRPQFNLASSLKASWGEMQETLEEEKMQKFRQFAQDVIV